ncbi:MAG: hypothetical protein ACP5QA_13055 [Phycisphaerae bacterium]
MVAIKLVNKLITYALDPAATEAEAINAATKAVRVARKEGVKPSALFAMPPHKPRRKRVNLHGPSRWDLIFPSGKYQGKTIRYVIARDRVYCHWRIEEGTDFPLDFLIALRCCYNETSERPMGAAPTGSHTHRPRYDDRLARC